MSRIIVYAIILFDLCNLCIAQDDITYLWIHQDRFYSEFGVGKPLIIQDNIEGPDYTLYVDHVDSKSHMEYGYYDSGALNPVSYNPTVMMHSGDSTTIFNTSVEHPESGIHYLDTIMTSDFITFINHFTVYLKTSAGSECQIYFKSFGGDNQQGLNKYDIDGVTDINASIYYYSGYKGSSPTDSATPLAWLSPDGVGEFYFSQKSYTGGDGIVSIYKCGEPHPQVNIINNTTSQIYNFTGTQNVSFLPNDIFTDSSAKLDAFKKYSIYSKSATANPEEFTLVFNSPLSSDPVILTVSQQGSSYTCKSNNNRILCSAMQEDAKNLDVSISNGICPATLKLARSKFTNGFNQAVVKSNGYSWIRLSAKDPSNLSKIDLYKTKGELPGYDYTIEGNLRGIQTQEDPDTGRDDIVCEYSNIIFGNSNLAKYLEIV